MSHVSYGLVPGTELMHDRSENGYWRLGGTGAGECAESADALSPCGKFPEGPGHSGALALIAGKGF